MLFRSLVIESDDADTFASATTRVTVAQFTDEGTAYGSVAGAMTDTWWRVRRTIGGTNPQFTYLVALAIR